MFLTAESLRGTGVLHFPSFSAARFSQLLPLSLAYMVHAMLVLRSLLYLNVAVYNTLKRMTPVLVLLFKVGRGRTVCMAFSLVVSLQPAKWVRSRAALDSAAYRFACSSPAAMAAASKSAVPWC